MSVSSNDAPNRYPPLNTLSNLAYLVATSNTYASNAEAKISSARFALVIGTITTISLAIFASPLTAIFAALGTVSLAVALVKWSVKDKTEVDNIDLLFRTTNTNEATFNQIDSYSQLDYSVRSLIKVNKDNETVGYYFVTHKNHGDVSMEEVENSLLTFNSKK
ncbi:MAG: hypothetical protein ACXU9U_03600 [Parachlamydiaceae bacterium]